jgi:hypothetical protein
MLTGGIALKWDTEDYKDWRVIEHGSWCNIENINTNFPDEHGVFIFTDSNLQVKFIGNTGIKGINREAMNDINSGKGYGATRANWLVTANDILARNLASELIDKYSPPNN